MHNIVRTKQKIFKHACQSFRTNSELLPASAYNLLMRAVLRSSRLTRSASIFRRLSARDCLFLGAICGREQEECYYILRKNIRIHKVETDLYPITPQFFWLAFSCNCCSLNMYAFSFSIAFSIYRSTQSVRVGSSSSPSMYCARIYPIRHFDFVNRMPLGPRTTSLSST